MKRKLFILTLLTAAVLAGCGGGGDSAVTTSTPPSTPAAAPGIYVTNANNTVTVFALDANGNTAPLRTLGGASTGLALPIGIATDRQGQLYVANRLGSKVTVYAITAAGDVAPTRSITAAGMGSPQGLAIGPTDDLYVSTCPNCGSGAGGSTGVFHFNNGSSTSDYQIAGANTGMTVPSNIALDSGRNLIVANSFGGNVAVFAPGASGNTLPIRSFTSPAGANLQGMSLGPNSGNNAIALTVPGRGVELYTSTAGSGAVPAATLAASSTLPIGYPGGVFFDNSVTPPIVYLVDYGSSAVHVIQTAGTAPNLTVASVKTIAGAATRLSSPPGLTVVR